MEIIAVIVCLCLSTTEAYLTSEAGNNAPFELELPENWTDGIEIAFKNRDNILFRVLTSENRTKLYKNGYTNRLKLGNYKYRRSVVFTLENVTNSDAGKYVCLKTSDKQPLTPCGELLIVTGKPTKPVLSVKAVPGKNVTINCSSTSTSLPSNHNLTMTFLWRRNDQLLPKDNNYNLDGSHLTIRDISKGKDGERFSCQAQEQDGLISDWSEEQYGPEQAILHPRKEDYNIREGNRIEINCSGDCNPVCNVKWWNRSQQGTESSSKGRAMLQLEVFRHTRGIYTCDVTNDYGTKTRHVNISVMYAPRITSFTANNATSLTVKEGDMVNFSCVGESSPSPVVSIVSPVKNITQSVATSHITRSHVFNSSFRINTTQCLDHGQYRCQVSNNINATRSDIVDLKVQCKPNQQEMIKIANASWNFSVWAYPKPSISGFYFSVHKTTVKRDLNGKKYKVQRLDVRENLYKYTFEIGDFESKDFGKYIFTFVNNEGTRNISVNFGDETSAALTSPEPPIVIIVSAVCSVMFVVVAVCVAIWINRNKKNKGEKRYRCVAAEDDIAVHDDKSSLYARVNKPKNKPGTAKRPKGETTYAYSTVMKNHLPPKACTDQAGHPSDDQALILRDEVEAMPRNDNNCLENNVEGLTYADLDLPPSPKVNGRPVINSKEESVVYEQIDFNLTPGPQLPEKIWVKENA